MKFSKKAIILGLLLLMILPATLAMGMVQPEMMPYPEPMPYTNFGSNQYYTVTFDGEGQALVSAKITIQNMGKEDLSHIQIEIPGESVRIINVVQEAKSIQKRCIEYENICKVTEEKVCLEYNELGSCMRYDYIYRPCQKVPQCIAWEEYYGHPLTYYKLEPDQQRLSHSTLLTLPLEQSIPPQESATLLLTYKATGYAEKSLGVWSFNFQSAKVPTDTDQVRVSIGTTPEFTLKGGKAEVDYLPEIAFASATKQGFASAEMSDFSRRIEYHGGFVKQTSGLDPWESFHVGGDYAKSKALLYKGRIISVISVALFLLVGLFTGIRKIKPHLTAKKSKPSTTNTALLVSAVSFVNAILLTGLWFFGFLILDNLYYWMGYQTSELLGVLLVFALVVLGLALLFGPSVFLGLRKGFLAGLFTFVGTILWIIAFLVFMIVLFSVVGGPMVYY